jgi:hypothetical protein
LHNNRGFYNPVCKEKLCVGCNSKPPTLSPDVIRNLCTSLCDVDESLVGDEALKKKKKRRTVTPVGGNMQSLEEVTSAPPASKKKLRRPQVMPQARLRITRQTRRSQLLRMLALLILMKLKQCGLLL